MTVLFHRCVSVSVVLLDLCDQFYTRLMASAQFLCLKEIIDDHLGQLCTYYALSHCDDLAVVVLFYHLGCEAVRADTRADAGDLVCCKRDTDACSAYQYTSPAMG